MMFHLRLHTKIYCFPQAFCSPTTKEPIRGSLSFGVWSVLCLRSPGILSKCHPTLLFGEGSILSFKSLFESNPPIQYRTVDFHQLSFTPFSFLIICSPVKPTKFVKSPRTLRRPVPSQNLGAVSLNATFSMPDTVRSNATLRHSSLQASLPGVVPSQTPAYLHMDDSYV